MTDRMRERYEKHETAVKFYKDKLNFPDKKFDILYRVPE